MKRLVILISGRGSNMQALVEAGLPASVAAVISNEPAARGLDIARAKGVPTAVVDHRAHRSREGFERALSEAIDTHAPHLVVLAGFMRILSPPFVERYAGRLINVHPSLLPAFAGIDTHRRALSEGVRLHGCTVHFVTAQVDAGPIIVQAAVPVLPGDDEAALAARVLQQEHRVLPQAVRWFLEDRLQIDGRRVQVRGAAQSASILVSPEEA
jgi:phosphoribosylglycinamide formyltransferase-1